jgi:hypothetical protein
MDSKSLYQLKWMLRALRFTPVSGRQRNGFVGLAARQKTVTTV